MIRHSNNFPDNPSAPYGMPQPDGVRDVIEYTVDTRYSYTYPLQTTLDDTLLMAKMETTVLDDDGFDAYNNFARQELMDRTPDTLHLTEAEEPRDNALTSRTKLSERFDGGRNRRIDPNHSEMFLDDMAVQREDIDWQRMREQGKVRADYAFLHEETADVEHTNPLDGKTMFQIRNNLKKDIKKRSINFDDSLVSRDSRQGKAYRGRRAEHVAYDKSRHTGAEDGNWFFRKIAMLIPDALTRAKRRTKRDAYLPNAISYKSVLRKKAARAAPGAAEAIRGAGLHDAATRAAIRDLENTRSAAIISLALVLKQRTAGGRHKALRDAHTPGATEDTTQARRRKQTREIQSLLRIIEETGTRLNEMSDQEAMVVSGPDHTPTDLNALRGQMVQDNHATYIANATLLYKTAARDSQNLAAARQHILTRPTAVDEQRSQRRQTAARGSGDTLARQGKIALHNTIQHEVINYSTALKKDGQRSNRQYLEQDDKFRRFEDAKMKASGPAPTLKRLESDPIEMFTDSTEMDRRTGTVVKGHLQGDYGMDDETYVEA